jgi:prepilin-type N-terminal cleavage/methylation domain-containing protein
MLDAHSEESSPRRKQLREPMSTPINQARRRWAGASTTLPRRRTVRPARAGMTLLEVMVSLSISLVAMGMFSSALVSTSRMGADKRMTALAANAARSAIEDMRAAPHAERFAQFNADPADDPEGAGTAPGRYFEVPGLDARADDPDGFVGEILIPTIEGKLREDAVDDRLGLPRDLNGDTLVDQENHAGDYVILPVTVRIEWRGVTGPRRIEMSSMLIDLAGGAP